MVNLDYNDYWTKLSRMIKFWFQMFRREELVESNWHDNKINRLYTKKKKKTGNRVLTLQNYRYTDVCHGRMRAMNDAVSCV